MNKIDLIIDALEKVINACNLYDRQDIQDGGTVYLEEELEASIKALAAARELRDAESKTQQWGNPKYLIEEAVLAERQACIDIVEVYRIPVGNSPQGELAADWTYAALHEIRDEIKQRGET